MHRPRPPRTIAELLEVHPHIERAVVCARIAGVAADEPLQERWIAHLERILGEHMAHEERWLLPVWEQVEDPPPNGTAQVLRQEHDTLRDLLQRAASTADALHRARLLSRLEAILEHHDLREAAAFKVRLDALIPRAQRDTWLQAIADDLARLPPEPPLPAIQRPSPPSPPYPSPWERLLHDLIVGEATALDRLSAACELRGAEARSRAGTATEERSAEKLCRLFAQVRGYLDEAAQGSPRTRWLARLAAFDRLEQASGLQALLKLTDAPQPARTRR